MQDPGGASVWCSHVATQHMVFAFVCRSKHWTGDCPLRIYPLRLLRFIMVRDSSVGIVIGLRVG